MYIKKKYYVCQRTIKLNKIMGYRSQVFFGVKKGLESKLENVFAEFSMHKYFTAKEVNYRWKKAGDDEWRDDEWVVFSGDYLKWYEDYDDVKGVTEIIEELNEKEDNAFMVAMGECGETHSEHGEWHEYIDCVRYLKVAL